MHDYKIVHCLLIAGFESEQIMFYP